VPKKILYLLSEDSAFISHRLPMARAAKRAGFEVHVATRITSHAEVFQREGFIPHPITWRRGSLNPLHLLWVTYEVRRINRQVKPVIIHNVSLVSTIIGSVASLGRPIVCLNAFIGLGYVFTADTLKAAVLRFFVKYVLRWLLGRKFSVALVQNPDDIAVVQSLGIRNAKIELIRGSGVDTDALTPLSEPPLPITMAFVGRLLTDKGLPTLIAAHELLVQRGKNVKLLIAGKTDPANPTSISDAVIAKWKLHPQVIFLGQVDNIGALWAKAHIAVLPSLREGLPLSLLEAAACGRPIVATDVPGCREIALPNVNALLVPVQDPSALADAIELLAENAELRLRFGVAGRDLVEREFSQHRISRDITDLYNRLVDMPPR
jgi:glycosyltransferase involved in cell wall biosynthesis